MNRRPAAWVGWLAAVLLAGPAHAVDTYQADPDHTFASFEFNHLGYSTQRNRFDTVRATVQLDLVNRTGSVEASIDVASVSTGSAAFNQTLQSPSFFDVANHPTITFRGTELGFDQFDRVSSVAGELTIKGVTKPVTLQVMQFRCMVHPLLRKEACGANATATVSRSAFGLGKFVPLVGNDVTLHIAIEALKQ